MDELRDLYQEIILDHNKNPKNFHVMEDATHKSDGHNPLCGDRLTVYLHVDGDRITDVSFQGSGCAISKASASVMTTALKGKTVAEARELFHKFQDMLTREDAAIPDLDEFGQLAAFAGVREFPVRVKCATLSWHTTMAALDDENKIVSTE
ncbi:MAG TPA: SUF system NifU family Fe-S cluster assembly protein [Bacteroidetes bacterium]|nr:SUF system NifU family Fe-S cluster assembly protein [Bacteroidota bacterium]